MDDVTLQINISAGDINYAELSVAHLVSAHAGIKKRLLIVDCCRPQKTTIMDPDIKFPKEEFERKVEIIVKIGQKLLADNIVTDLYLVRPDDPMIDYLSKKYLRGLYKTTHGAGGMVNMSYWVGFDLPQTKYLLHYDGDIMVYQKPGYSWVSEAIQHMQNVPQSVIAVPRLCPPVDDPDFQLPSLHEGRKNESYDHFWLNDFFSSRQFLMDKERLQKYLPLVQGKVMLELLVRKYARRAFPLDPEILMMKSIGSRGGRRMVLKTKDSWIIHPIKKDQYYLDNLPKIISKIEAGQCPEGQKGHENINLDLWRPFLETNL